MDFDIVKKAGLTQSQFANLIGVSRITVNTWFKGHFNPQVRLRGRVRKAIDLLRKAIDNGELPVRPDARNAELTRQLTNIEQLLRTEA